MRLNKTDVIDLDAFTETCKDCIIERQEKEIVRLNREVTNLKEALHEVRMQYISDFGREQENEPTATPKGE